MALMINLALWAAIICLAVFLFHRYGRSLGH
jgi:hypothetical protein